MSKRITRPTIPLEPFLTCPVSKDKWGKGIEKFMGRVEDSNMTLEEFHKSLWMRQLNRKKPRKLTKGSTSFLYEMPNYQVSVSNTKGIQFEVPAHFDRNQALDAMGDYLDVIGVGNNSLLTMSEYVDVMNHGINAVRGKEFVFPQDDDVETLRKFVLNYCDGKVWTSENVRPDMIQMVFIPVMLGALDLPEDLKGAVASSLPPNPGSVEDFVGLEPKDDELPSLLPEPLKPISTQPDTERMDELERKAFFGTLAVGESLEGYMDEIESKNRTGLVLYDMQMAAWEADNATIMAQREAIIQANAKRKDAWLDRKKMNDDTRAFDKAKARYSVAMEGVFQQYWKDLGCIWEALDGRNTTTMSVNGMPMFLSCRLMSKTMLARANAAIKREMEHRKSIVV